MSLRVKAAAEPGAACQASQRAFWVPRPCCREGMEARRGRAQESAPGGLLLLLEGNCSSQL